MAAAALDAGFALVNDVTAGRADPALLPTVAERGAAVCLVHMRGDPRTMQSDPRYGDVVREVRDHLAARLEAAVDAGVPEERVLLDPGIGFGKTLEHNLALLAGLPALAGLGRPLLVGVSRKGMFGTLLGRDVDERMPASVAGGAGGGGAGRGGAARARRARYGRRAGGVDGGGGRGGAMSDERLTISIRGLEAFGRHGVHDSERELGQRFVVDLDLELLAPRRPCAATTWPTRWTTRPWRRRVAAIVTGPPVRLLERLAGLIADRALRGGGRPRRHGDRAQAARRPAAGRERDGRHPAPHRP